MHAGGSKGCPRKDVASKYSSVFGGFLFCGVHLFSSMGSAWFDSKICIKKQCESGDPDFKEEINQIVGLLAFWQCISSF